MNYKHLAFVLAAVSLLAGCSVHRLDYREVSTRLIEPNQGALVTPLIADMELVSEEKIQPYTEEFGQLTCQSLSCVEVYKKTALLNAAKKYGADVIVAAAIEVETTDSGNLKITVMGFRLAIPISARQPKKMPRWSACIRSSIRVTSRPYCSRKTNNR